MATSTHSLFNDKAEAYAKYRPDYPAQLIDQLFLNFTSPNITAVDVGAGTGISSRVLGDRGAQVIASEPNQSMIEAAKFHPNVVYKNTSAENLGLDNNCADLITVFQAFHWFDFKSSLREFNRVLKTTGHLALIWSYWDFSDPFTAQYAELIRQAAHKNPQLVTPYDGFPGGLIKRIRVKMLRSADYLPYFKNLRKYRYKYIREATLEMLIGDARSQSYLIHEGEPWDQLIGEIEELYSNSSNPRIAYSTYLYMAQPRDK